MFGNTSKVCRNNWKYVEVQGNILEMSKNRNVKRYEI